MSASQTPFFGESVLSNCSLSVLSEWTDYNDHFNVAYYMRAFDLAAEDLKTSHGSAVRHWQVNKSRVTYLREVPLGKKLQITTQVIAATSNILHLLQAMYSDGELSPVAIEERIETRVPTDETAPPVGLTDSLANKAQEHKSLHVPDGWGDLSVRC